MSCADVLLIISLTPLVMVRVKIFEFNKKFIQLLNSLYNYHFLNSIIYWTVHIKTLDIFITDPSFYYFTAEPNHWGTKNIISMTNDHFICKWVQKVILFKKRQTRLLTTLFMDAYHNEGSSQLVGPIIALRLSWVNLIK